MASADADLRRTPLYPVYSEHGARLVPFSGWEMPVQFSGISREHRAVRETAGLFDVSHMGEIEVRGDGAPDVVQRLMSNDVGRLRDGRALYTPMCRPHGGVIDDLLVYRLAADRLLLVPNAANVDKDFDHVREVAARAGGAEAVNRSDDYALLALQGPRAVAILERVYEGEAEDSPTRLRPFRFRQQVPVAGRRARLISRTGYTGEDGFELYVAPGDAVAVWRALMEAGAPDGLVPAGLGARDTLRFEACLALYGNELNEETNPLEAGLDPFVKLDRGDFIGRDALLRVSEQGPARRLVGLEMIDRGIPRHGYTVRGEGAVIGVVTSGTRAPTLGRDLALAYVPSDRTAVGTEVAVEIRGCPRRARVVKTPFYRR